MSRRLRMAVVCCVLVVSGRAFPEARQGGVERFTATMVANNNFASGTGTLIMDVARWSTEAERQQLTAVLFEKGPKVLVDELRRTRAVGTIRTPGSLAYDLRYSYQSTGEDGGRRIVLITDRPIGFSEAVNQPRTIDYPFTVVQMQFDAAGKGRGTLAYASRLVALRNTIVVEDFGTQPVMLTEITAERR